MKVIQTVLEGAVIIEPQVFGDERGYFLEAFHAERYRDEAGIIEPFVQDNHSRSSKGVLRGLHFQITQPQGKLVRVSQGEVFDVAVDINPESATYKQWVGVVLSGSNHLQFYVPPGYAHGFLVLSETADFQYKCTDYYNPSDEGCVKWDDPEIGIEWPIEGEPRLSEKDAGAKPLG
ncbi:MAG: dTDP-4-dehydrorhamnose 3,5-epimerase [Pseudomonadales bacterium]|nr:dTDP-4-dehydrorhamnose 3,5-epimerase [Pseudomonadales bacterium]